MHLSVLPRRWPAAGTQTLEIEASLPLDAGFLRLLSHCNSLTAVRCIIQRFRSVGVLEAQRRSISLAS